MEALSRAEIDALNALGTDGPVIASALNSALDAIEESVIRDWIINRLKMLANGG